MYFSNISSKLLLSGNTVWSILSFQGFYILFFQGSNTSFHLKLKYFLVSKSLLKKLYRGQYGVAQIVLSRILRKFPPKLGYFLVFKSLLKNCICITVWPILPFQRYYANLYRKLIFFLEFKNLFKNLNQGQYGLTLIFLFKDSINFSLKAL